MPHIVASPVRSGGIGWARVFDGSNHAPARAGRFDGHQRLCRTHEHAEPDRERQNTWGPHPRLVEIQNKAKFVQVLYCGYVNCSWSKQAENYHWYSLQFAVVAFC